MRLAPTLIPFLALAVCACDGGPRPSRFDLPTPPPPRERPVWQKPSPAAAHHVAPVSPSGPAGPLTVARVGSYMDSLETDLRRHVHGAGIVVARQGDAVTVVIPNADLFSGDGGISGDDVLEPLGAVLKGYVHTAVQVSGFTDTSGTPEQNLAVSQKRAGLIAAALAHEGVPQARLTAQGFGETHLRFATGDNKKDPRNRRIEILLRARPG
jgi:outer membrane protein OmpA-like peptidoglycan-associated protein